MMEALETLPGPPKGYTYLFNTLLPVRRVQLALMNAGKLKSITKFIGKAFRSLPSKKVEIEFDNGPLMVLLNDTSHYSIAIGKHEPKVKRWVEENVGPGFVVIDVGANIGFFSLICSKLVTKTGHVFAVEPDPRTREILEWNVKANSASNITPVLVAMHDHRGTVRFGLADSTAWSGIQCESASSWIDVPCTTVDDLKSRWPYLKRLDLVKIDVEGTEMNVLNGMTGVIEKYSPAILVELHGTDEQIHNHPAKQWLREHGYTFEYLEYWMLAATKAR